MTITLRSPVTTIPLIGEAYLRKLEALGVKTIEDLLWHVPSRYLDTRDVTDIMDIQDDNSNYVLMGKITKAKGAYTRRRMFIFNATLEDQTGNINVVWFNQKFIGNSIKPGVEVLLYGKAQRYGSKLILQSPEYEVVYETGKTRHLGILAPIYHLTYGVSQKWLRGRIRFVVDKLGKDLKCPLADALREIHLPSSPDALEKARETLAFEELYEIMRNVIKRKAEHQRFTSPEVSIAQDMHDKLIGSLPYKLTSSQAKAITELYSDLKRTYPMDRLLTGDVGSGKTIVAVAGAIQVLKSGFDVLLMAPTAILASQHFESIGSILKNFPYPTRLILGKSSVPSPQSPEFSPQSPVFYIGTHALLYHPEYKSNVGLVIVDEQHRFGVKQRDQLVEYTKLFGKKQFPHRLTLTATPIPRTMALVFFGDQELSYLSEKPFGRLAVISKYVSEKIKPKLYDTIRQKLLKEGSQLFVVCPLIEESEALQAKAVESEFALLQKTFSEFKIALLHGRLKNPEKDKVLNSFKTGKTRILVTTPVVEVGIDIPQADLMIIEGAERFGLSQLHQLRGRVGRGDKQSYCFVTTTKPSSKAIDRITYFCKTNDGLKLAEYDLGKRGPGEVYGYKQSGIPELKIARLDDFALIAKARNKAIKDLQHKK